ncbi:DUF4955 domain-containing protein [Thalassotalea fonticola]|uniref:DUF4955 domain-containing protein n=1 Tax=Thalassotalea fonticola TaxID=3065649 RepID=A0ABZ0GKK2_9GAMM|nr:DUF4955 domain-containing protein [Colwelliaceae bacterium S1-1]
MTKNMVQLMCCLFISACTGIIDESVESEKETLWQNYLKNSSQERVLMDFSHAGVNFSDSAIPELALPIFDVTSYGAVADDGIEDKDAIQRTINAAEKAGGGIVQLPAGRFLVNEMPGQRAGLRVSSSNVILRGSQNDSRQTELFMEHHLEPVVAEQLWTVPAMITFQPANSQALTSNSAKRQYSFHTQIIENSAANSEYVTVLNAEQFQIGDMVTFEMEDPAANNEYLHGKPVRGIWQRINTKGVMVAESHQIKKISGNRLYFMRPTLTRINVDYGWKIGKVPSITNVGIEKISFKGNFNEKFKHHKNYIHDSGFSAVKLIRTSHSWVRNCKFTDVSYAVTVEGGMANSVLLNSIEGNSGHGSFTVSFGTRNLVGLNIDTSSEGQWHGPGASHLSVGNVFWKFYSPTSRGIDAHSVFPRHTLFDAITSHGFGGWGGSYATLPNHLEGLVFWNFTQLGSAVSKGNEDNIDFWNLPESDSEKYGFLTAVNPILVGYRGSATSINENNLLKLESVNQHVTPSSLFEAQLNHRLGTTPDWLIESIEQWQILKNRRH